MGLPCPALALQFPDQLETNLTLVDQLFPRGPKHQTRRLMLGMDGTYLLKQHSQCFLQGRVGLVGGPWTPSDETQSFVELTSCSKSLLKAATMMEFLLWNPLSPRQECYSVAAMPMALAAPTIEKKTQVHAGNWVPRSVYVCFVIICFQCDLLSFYCVSPCFYMFPFYSVLNSWIRCHSHPYQEVLLMVGKLFEAGSWLIKGITYDNHHSHRYLKEALYGDFRQLEEHQLAELPFWKDVRYEPLPLHCLPHLPLRLCIFEDDSIWGLAGPCNFFALGAVWNV